MNTEERVHRFIATKRKNYKNMATTVPDQKASEDFHRPVYQAAALVRKQGEQMKTESVAEYLARKYEIGDDASGHDKNKKQCEKRE